MNSITLVIGSKLNMQSIAFNDISVIQKFTRWCLKMNLIWLYELGIFG